MIILEDKLMELFNGLPDINIDISGTPTPYPIFFNFGNPDDLNKYLKEKEKRYPLVWLETGFDEDQGEFDASFDINIILATYALDAKYDNQQRLDISFKTVLIPLLENIIFAFENSNNMSIVEDNYTLNKYYNYGDETHNNTDVWDAIKLGININVTYDCFELINY